MVLRVITLSLIFIIILLCYHNAFLPDPVCGSDVNGFNYLDPTVII